MDVQANRIEPNRNLLPIACCQKNVIFLDRSNEIKSMEFTSNDGKKMDGFERLKKILMLHLQVKKILTPQGRNDEHYLLFEANSGKFSCNPKSDIDAAINQLKKVTVDSKPADENQFFQLDDILRRCFELAPLPPDPQLLDSNFELYCPPYIVRVLLIVTRSRGQVLCDLTPELERMLHNPFLFLDILYLHENHNATNNVNEIFKNLCVLDKHNGYVFESGPNLTNWYSYSAYLLAHPMLRQQFDKFRQTRNINAKPEETLQKPDAQEQSTSQTGANRTDVKLVDV